ncbi:hypothetical protein [Paraburkholderia sediminicola]|uniref:hypothetical protein n=1 Tax=Paraburkholderia sediminicola TaxID=458836 RepID=UPI0038BCDB51
MTEGFPVDIIEAATQNQYTRYIAELILSSDKVAERRKLPWDYKTLVEFGEEDFIFHGDTFWAFEYETSSKKPDTQGWHKGAIKEMNDYVWRSVIYEDDGVQFYIRNADGSYREAGAEDRSYDLIHQIAADAGFDTLKYYAPPSWWTDLHVGHANYEAYNLVFSETPGTRDPRYPWFKQEKAAIVRRETERRLSVPVKSIAVREPIVSISDRGLELPPSNAQRAKGMLMELATEVQDRFWGEKFDPDDRGTWSSQEVILLWIKERQLGISDANAKAVEKVACPVERGIK